MCNSDYQLRYRRPWWRQGEQITRGKEMKKERKEDFSSEETEAGRSL